MPADPTAPAASDTLVVLPALNEATRLGAVLDGIHRGAPDVAVLVIDDGSRDATAAVAREHGADVVAHPFNLGYGAALQTGYKHALRQGYRYLVQMDADGQHDPASARALLEPVLAGTTDVAIGSRFLGRAEYPIPGLRRAGMRVFSAIVTFVTRRHFSDPTSGFQAMNHRAMTFFARDNYPTDFPDADTIILLSLAGFRVSEVPVTMRARTAGTSMHSNLSAFYYVSKMTLSILMVLLRRGRFRA